MHSSWPRKVKIVCTLGPSSKTVAQIQALIEEGMEVARLNFSHGTHEQHREVIRNVREASKITGKPVAIMQDLQGPKIRVGVLPKEGVFLKNGEVLLLHPEGATPRMSTQGRTLLPIGAEIAMPISQTVRAGARILFDDGKLAARVLEVKPPEMVVEMEVGGKLTSNKGMNFPGTPLTIPCLTEKDQEDLKFGLSEKVDAVALSFVQSSEDIEDLRARIKQHSTEIPLIVAKLEREEAIENQNSIIEVTDVLLIARGDMAVEVGAERVPTIQKKLIHTCNELGVPVITATQMLESMIRSPTPTRAEANDVANAVFDGTDAVMLSGETASGEYPREAVATMARIILESERSRDLNRSPKDLVPLPGSIVESIEFSASRIAHHVGAVAIACITHSGMAARVLSKFRPETPIIAVMENEQALRKLSFNWGVRGIVIPKLVSTDDIFSMIGDKLMQHHLAEQEDLVVITAGVPTLRRGTTNTMKVHRVGANHERRRSP